ncbi:MAG: hypothetical protein ACYCTI_03680 [Acidimicrobiales bacterium]
MRMIRRRLFPLSAHRVRSVLGAAILLAVGAPGLMAAAATPGGAATPAAAGLPAQATTTTTSTTTTTTTVPTSTTTTQPSGTASGAPVPPSTYWLAGSDGAVYAFGEAPYAGSEAGHQLNRPVVGMAGVPGQKGYWLVASDGGIFAFGTAGFFGSTGAERLNKPIVGMAATPDGRGYWLVAADGGIFTFGDAGFFGSTGAERLNQPIVGMAPTPDGRGYYLVAADGGIFTFGDAVFRGSTGAIHLNQPIVGMALTPDGAGYWLAASDGGIFNFGDATFQGSHGGSPVPAPVVGISAPTTGTGQGYWMAAANGAVYAYGAAVFHGAPTGKVSAPVVAVATGSSLDPYTSGTTGYDISWPQCPGQSNDIPTAPAAVSVVGVNGGAAFNHNNCLSAEAAWGRQGGLTLYMNINSPFVNDPTQGATGPAGTCAPTDSNCMAYNYGYNDAEDAWSYATGLGVASPMWWLDVEGPAGSGNPLWSSDTTANDQVVAGALAALTSLGAQPGIYSTVTQWDEIAGSSYAPDVPAWRAGAGDITGAQSLCTTSSFTSGQTWLVQYGSPNPVDNDYAC